MSITEELRKFAWKECPSKFLERVIGIADDIDAALADYIPLPKDADGEVIRVGDKVVDWDTPRLVVAVSEDSICLAGYESDSYYRMGIAKNYHHVQPDSWDRILCEFAGRVLKSGHQWGLDAPETTEEFVERCKRLAGEGE